MRSTAAALLALVVALSPAAHGSVCARAGNVPTDSPPCCCTAECGCCDTAENGSRPGTLGQGCGCILDARAPADDASGFQPAAVEADETPRFGAGAAGSAEPHERALRREIRPRSYRPLLI
jgi:hypothetical protein